MERVTVIETLMQVESKVTTIIVYTYHALTMSIDDIIVERQHWHGGKHTTQLNKGSGTCTGEIQYELARIKP